MYLCCCEFFGCSYTLRCAGVQLQGCVLLVVWVQNKVCFSCIVAWLGVSQHQWFCLVAVNFYFLSFSSGEFTCGCNLVPRYSTCMAI